MKPKTPDQIRKLYLDFFVARGHVLVPSASLVPENDPTLLFTGAGMNQFKDLFLGRGAMPYRRATSCQKCFRTGDLEEVGRTNYHHTFFEMLGNFSFGDYFKRDAIHWAWTFLLEELKLDPNRLSATVYADDDEAYDVWRDEIGLPDERVTRLGAKSNFWPSNAPEAGPNGPCGPCSEIFFDYGEQYSCGPECRKEDCDCPRYCEIWNLVFTQFDRVGKNQLEPLPQRNIDTGAGFERLVAVVEGELSTFGTTLFRPILRKIADLAERQYVFESPEGVRIRRIADHVRAAVFCLVDGVKPGRDGREFVLRRVIRRAVRDGIALGIERPFLGEVAPVVAEVMGGAYPAIEAGISEVVRHLGREEERFRATYQQGMNALEEAVRRLDAAGGRVLSGDVAFKLHDERGFPVDVTEDYLREQGFSLDRDGFASAMERRRRESQEGSKIEADIFARGPIAEVRADHGPTEFLGYDTTESTGRVLALVVNEERRPQVEAGQTVRVVTDRTPFYAESGGQIGDAGTIEGGHGRVRVTDTRSAEGVFYMSGVVEEGRIADGEVVRLVVDRARRDAIRRNHTATHLLHRALKSRLGEGAVQAGSLVAPDRLRFDFHHDRPLTEEEIRAVEDEVNREVLANTVLDTAVKPLDQARAEGAVAMFGEKYGDVVRVVQVGEYSRELCGGTHCRATGDVGAFRIVSESNIGAGLRRIEAVTGEGTIALMRRERDVLRALAERLKVPPDDAPARVDALRNEVKELRRKLDQALASGGGGGPEELVETLPNGIVFRVLTYPLAFEQKQLLAAADAVRAKDGREVALLTAQPDGGVPVVVAATKEAVKCGVHAGNLVKEVSAKLGGGGGGRPDLGQGKGRDEAELPAAIAALRALLAGLVPTA